MTKMRIVYESMLEGKREEETGWTDNRTVEREERKTGEVEWEKGNEE